MTRAQVCPQCGSECGPVACRFSGITHQQAAQQEGERQAAIARYADAMTQRDLEPRWEREHRQGAADKPMPGTGEA